ncbi:MAG: hypothetical protein KAS32_07490 [Candidatus Peribacteraceae bacterium]|nr:hypothetical protein [Candidatus Peribacteraceae bacterium]
MDIKNEKVISWSEAKKILSDKEKNKELVYEQKNALDHLRKFCKLPETKSKKIIEELGTMENLKERHIVGILNFLPENLDELRTLFSNDRIVLSEDDSKKIVKIVKDNK